jgi:hypothetical protein
LINALNLTLCDCRFICDSKYRLDLVLELVKVVYLGVNVLRGVTLIVLLDKRFNLGKSFSTYITCNKCNTFLCRHLVSLKHKEEVLLYKLVIKLGAISIVEVRLVNINIISFNSVSHVRVMQARATRGSMCF